MEPWPPLPARRQGPTLEAIHMMSTKTKKNEGEQAGRKARPESLWNVILHNEWHNALRWVILILRKVIPGIGLKRATKTAWEAHRKG